MRIIYNTSFIIDEDIETAWIGFIRKNYISVLQTNRLCEDIIFTKVSIDQPEGKTYSLQLVFNSEEQQNHFLDEWLPDIEKKIMFNYVLLLILKELHHHVGLVDKY